MNKHISNQKGFTPLVIVLIVVVVGLACGAGYYVWQKNHDIKEVDSAVGVTASATPAPTASPTPTKADETVGWKTYTNSRVGYSFKYPASDLTFGIDETIKYPSTRAGDSKTQDLVQLGMGDTMCAIRVYVNDGSGGVESWMKTSSMNLNDYTKVTVNGRTAYQLTNEAVLYVAANNNVYDINAHQGSTAPAKIISVPIFNKWISTIQFTQ